MGTITVCGTWNKDIAEFSKKIALEVGREIARRDLILISGAGEGVSKYVVEGYRSNGGRLYTALLAAPQHILRNGGKLGPEPDQTIKLDTDYPQRNLEMLRRSERIIALNGGLGTLTEIINASYDYKLPVAVIRFGWFSKIVDQISKVYPLDIYHTENIPEAIDYLLRGDDRNVKTGTCFK